MICAHLALYIYTIKINAPSMATAPKLSSKNTLCCECHSCTSTVLVVFIYPGALSSQNMVTIFLLAYSTDSLPERVKLRIASPVTSFHNTGYEVDKEQIRDVNNNCCCDCYFLTTSRRRRRRCRCSCWCSSCRKQ